MDHVNMVHILYGINIFTLGASSPDYVGLVYMKLLYSTTLIIKIIIIVNIY